MDLPSVTIDKSIREPNVPVKTNVSSSLNEPMVNLIVRDTSNTKKNVGTSSDSNKKPASYASATNSKAIKNKANF